MRLDRRRRFERERRRGRKGGGEAVDLRRDGRTDEEGRIKVSDLPRKEKS